MRAFYENSDHKLIIFEEENFTFPHAHWHTRVELAFVLEGDIVVGVNEEKRLLQQGDAVIAGSGDIHYYDGRNRNSRMLLLIFDPDLVDVSVGWPGNIRFLTPYIIKTLQSDDLIDKLKALVYLLKGEMESGQDQGDMFIKSYIYNICGLLLRHLPTTEQSHRPDVKVLSRMKLLQDIFTYIESNYVHDITVADIAKQFNMSIDYFSRLFNSISHINFKTHLNTLRVEAAEKMIIEGILPLTDIAYECGFSSIRTFNRAYKSIKGYAPSSLRKNL